jgi:hypothetical protein
VKPSIHRIAACALAALLAVTGDGVPPLFAQATPASGSTAAPQDRWPRKLSVNGSNIDFYTPQLDSWDGRSLSYHAAVSITPPGAKEPIFGVVFATATTNVDKTTRLVELTDLDVTKVSFPSRPEANEKYLETFRTLMKRKGSVTIALDRLEANLSRARTSSA